MSYCIFRIIPKFLIEGSSSFLKPISASVSSSRICLITATEFDIHFVAYIPAIPHYFDKSWYSLVASVSVLLESMLSSMNVEQSTVSAASGSSGLFFLACSLLTNCAWNGDKLISSINLVNCNTFDFSFCFKDLHSILWYGQSIGCIPILRYISAILHTKAMWYL